MMNKESLLKYVLRLGDNAMILGQRISEWCGHGPILEQDIAMTNIALDYIGQARNWYILAGEIEGKGRTDDDFAFLRKEEEYYNLLLVEQENEDWAYTIVRQFLFDAFNYYYLTALMESSNAEVAGIAAKSIKEVTYHLRFSSEWMIRLGDGTELSNEKMQEALDFLWQYSGEAMIADQIDEEMLAEGIAPDLATIQAAYNKKVEEILTAATLTMPQDVYMQRGGKTGKHTEALGFLLAEMQYMQRVYPGLEW